MGAAKEHWRGGPGERTACRRHHLGAAAVVLGMLAAAPAGSAELVELHKWFSRGRGDNTTTTHPSWVGAPNQTRSPDYRFSAVEGRILAADTPRMPAMVPLHRWYSAGRGDNSTTSHPSWQGGPGQSREPDDRYSRFEGYAFDRPIAGTIPLVRWYSGEISDNHATTHPSWIPAGTPGEERSPGYASHRIDGWIYPPEGTLARGHDASLFGYGSRRVTGSRPLLVILLEFNDVRLSQPDSFYERMVFGPEDPNIPAYFRAMSGGRFTWTRAAVVRVRIPQDASDAVATSDLSERIMRQVAQNGFRYARFDADRDGRLEKHELGVLRIVSDYFAPYTGGGQNSGLPNITVDGVRLELESANCNEYGDLKLLAHELLHQLGVVEHIYGPGRALNNDASPMASNGLRSGGGPVELDPFSAMVLGWMKPRLVPITAAGGVASLGAAQHADSDAGPDSPVLFYDPKRGFNEYFVVEYRTPSTPLRPDGGYDAKVHGQGLAVWYVQRQANGKLVTFDWPPTPVEPKAGGDMFANYYIGPDGPGDGRFLTAADGELALLWGDESDSKLRLRAAPMSPSSPTAGFQWRHADHPFLPRIDEVRPTTFRRGQTIVLDGLFPAPRVGAGEVQVVLASSRDAAGVPLEIRSHTSGRITARVPPDAPEGILLLTVRSSGSNPRSGGNSVYVRVTEEGS